MSFTPIRQPVPTGNLAVHLERIQLGNRKEAERFRSHAAAFLPHYALSFLSPRIGSFSSIPPSERSNGVVAPHPRLRRCRFFPHPSAVRGSKATGALRHQQRRRIHERRCRGILCPLSPPPRRLKQVPNLPRCHWHSLSPHYGSKTTPLYGLVIL
uniref:Uncharacterized protein n=1 Tax=Oryza sativa subsp. japonica TaxID=39947 RepID=Q7XHN0_ORYSJ|nr:hypothetical protein [Oryza sativa Japonica Group]BAD31205.1 hypothetical protein [Oryza sativa Japonica Group]